MVDPRYARQAILRIFEPGDLEKLRGASVAMIGVGGTGSLAADLFARIGVGRITLVDRDYVSISNLHRQVLYTDSDIGEPKVDVASRRLRQVNPDVRVEARNATFDSSVAEEIVGGSDLVFDGSDNFTTRMIINDACVKLNRPWIYTSAIETYGEAKAIIPGKTSCLSCYMSLPETRQPVCSEVGVFPSVPSMVSSFAFTLAVKIILGREVSGNLYFLDPWRGEFQGLAIKRNNECRTCSERRFDYLSDKFSSLGANLLV